MLILLQYGVNWTSVRSKRVRNWVKAEPRLPFRDGAFLERAMREERVTQDELLAAIRLQGHAEADAVHSVVLETDGSMSVTQAARK